MKPKQFEVKWIENDVAGGKCVCGEELVLNTEEDTECIRCATIWHLSIKVDVISNSDIIPKDR